MKRVALAIIALMTIGLTNCGKDEEEPGIDVNKSVVINELMPKNSRFGSDQNGQFDDWIELYNLSAQDIDLSGFYLTDSKKEPTKWKFPVGTMIEKNGYLIVWADADTLQAGLHTNYKLSADGENVVFLSPDKEVIDLVEYPPTLIEQSYARIPNGTEAVREVINLAGQLLLSTKKISNRTVKHFPIKNALLLLTYF